MLEAELELDAKASLGEGPCWDARRQLLYWVDIEGRRLHVYDPARRKDRAISLGQMIGSVVTRRAGGLQLALQQGFYAFDPGTENLTPLADPEIHLPQNR